jgi:hypothetical protein
MIGMEQRELDTARREDSEPANLVSCELQTLQPLTSSAHVRASTMAGARELKWYLLV